MFRAAEREKTLAEDAKDSFNDDDDDDVQFVSHVKGGNGSHEDDGKRSPSPDYTDSPKRPRLSTSPAPHPRQVWRVLL